MKLFVKFICFFIAFGCVSDVKNEKSSDKYLSSNKSPFIAQLTELSDFDYPDNPDVMVRHKKYTTSVMESIQFIEGINSFDLVIHPTNKDDDTVFLNAIHLMEFMPTVPEYAKDNSYMSLISIVNQEWNRNQVKWVGTNLDAVFNGAVVNGESITRVDIARNCLESYLWELFFYAEEDGKDKVFYHGWFNFPKNLYKELFERRNTQDFKNYREYLEHWKTPPSKVLDLNKIRTIQEKWDVTFITESLNDSMYPIRGERKKKEIEIIYPKTYTKIADFQTDSARFATFSSPGFYNRREPRKTQLGRFKILKKVERCLSENRGEVLDELHFIFERENGEQTQFIFGGLKLDSLLKLSVTEANSGNQYSMGIGNHPFYEDVVAHESQSSRSNPYFGVLLDEEGKWLDSHEIGIDGPLLHLSEDGETLHVWLLSFERHALVGHYSLPYKPKF